MSPLRGQGRKYTIMEAQIREMIRTALPRVADGLERLLRNSIRITAHPTDEDALPIGVSKMGGSPDLPVGVDWPTKGISPLSFVAQIRLPDATEYDAAGILPR